MKIKHYLKVTSVVLIAMTSLVTLAVGQNPSPPEGWHHLDRISEQYNGISTAKAYELLEGKESTTVIVAVIDSGVDPMHEDLKDNMWVNQDEIAGNGVDDDKNGYVDDIYGWNFIGETDKDTYELTRLYVVYHEKFGDKEESQISKSETEDYEFYKKLKKDLEWQINTNTEQYNLVNQFFTMYQKSSRLITAYADTEEIDLDELRTIESPDQKITAARDLVIYALENHFEEDDIQEYLETLTGILEYGYNPEFDPRPMVGDNPTDLYEKGYGNGNVKGPGSHGTQVAGVIAATRGNGIGIDGIADNVKIMALRAVPDGDERDKDVANAIIYAVDNGAKIINMSFGKSYSPQKIAVDKAVEYADSKGVLLIHAAGNDNKNTDENDNFPTPDYSKSKAHKNWIEVGASSWGEEDNFVASFSNYGKKGTDVFAPGVAIHTTSPDNEYDSVDGTSFASPVTTGVAALIMSYFPNLSSEQVRDVLLSSSVKYEKMKVNKPGPPDEDVEMVEFGELSKTGGVVNAFEAVKFAESLKVGKKK